MSVANPTVPSDEAAPRLRQALVDRLRELGIVYSRSVETAMGTVPRHLFLPGRSVEDAYALTHVVTRHDAEGKPLSSLSSPGIVGMMLEQLELQPSHNVLEIGAGTGYNAALLRELVGEAGEVTTIDIDPETADQARTRLAAAGYTDVGVIAGDGGAGEPAHAPYDRIIATTGAWEVPPAWIDQLTAGGRIVVPLRWRGLTRSVALDHDGDHLVCRSMYMCGFIPMRGTHRGGERTLDLDGHVTLHYDDDQPIDAAALRGVLDQPASEAWSGVTIGPNKPFDGVWVRMTLAEPGTCRMAIEPTAKETGRIKTPSPGTYALAEDDSLAYFTYRTLPGPERLAELGAIGHGPRSTELSQRIIEQIRRWAPNRGAVPTLHVFPAATPDDQLPPGAVIDKHHTRLVFSWPQESPNGSPEALEPMPDEAEQTPSPETSALWEDIARLHAHHGPIVLSNQLIKLTEEIGEVAEAYIGMQGLNARKGVCRTRDDLLTELGDVIVTAAIAMVAASDGDPDKARKHFEHRVCELTTRAGLD